MKTKRNAPARPYKSKYSAQNKSYGIGGAVMSGVNSIMNKQKLLPSLLNAGKAFIDPTPMSTVTQGLKLGSTIAGKSKNPAIQKLGQVADLAGNVAGVVGGGGAGGGGIMDMLKGFVPGMSAANGMKVLKSYENGGKPKGEGGSIDWRDYKKGEPLNPEQLEFLTQTMSDEERVLFQDMYSQDIIRGDDIKDLLRQEKPVNVARFREMFLKKNAKGATQDDLKTKFTKNYIGEGMKEQGKGVGRREINTGQIFADVDVDPVFRQEPRTVEDVDMLDLRKPGLIPTEYDKDIIIPERKTEESFDRLVEEDDELEPDPEIRESLEPSTMDLRELDPSDYTGSTEDQRAVGPWSTTTRDPRMQGITLLREGETQEDGGAVYAHGGRIPNHMLRQMLRKDTYRLRRKR
jgi:hypothetical protein